MSATQHFIQLIKNLFSLLVSRNFRRGTKGKTCTLLVIKFYKFLLTGCQQEDPYKSGSSPSDTLHISDSEMHIFFVVLGVFFDI